MAFDIQTTQRSLPGRGGGVAFQADLSTGQAQIAVATGALAGAVQNTAITLNRLQAENQLSEAKRVHQEILDQFQDAIEREPDSSLYPEIAKQAQEAMSQIAPKNRLAKRGYRRLFNITKVGMANTVLDVSLARERDTKRADVALMMTKGQFDRARKAIRRGTKDGTYSKVQAEALIAESRKEEAEFVKRGRRGLLVELGQNQASVDDAMDAILKEGLRIGAEKADITFAQQQVKDDFARFEAARKQGEEDRVAAEDADLSKRMYADTGKTTTAEVHAANLPRTVRDPLLTSIRLRDKEIAEGKKVVTSPLTRTRINLIKASVTVGEQTAQQGITEFFTFQDDVEIKERTDVIDLFFKAEKDSKDETKRRNQSVLTEQGGRLRDAIERSQGIITLIKDEQREFLVDLANDAVIELNDRFRDLKFEDADIKAFNDTLLRKYTLSDTAVSRAVSMKNVLAKKTFAKQVEEMVAKVKNASAFDRGPLIDEGMRLGLINEDGTPSTATREAIKEDNTQLLDALLKRR